MKILLADDHALFRAALAPTLRELTDDLTIIEAGTCAEMLAMVDAHPDLTLALVDIRMPDGDGIDALAERCDRIPMVVVSSSENVADMQRAFKAGALGYMPKTITPALMMRGLRLILAGGIYVPPEIFQSREPSPRPEDVEKISQLGLSERQRQVLALLAEGKTNKTIARELGISESTIKWHLAIAFKALKAENRNQAARIVRSMLQSSY